MGKYDRVFRNTWTDYHAGGASVEMIGRPPIWTVCMGWVLKRHRGAGLGQALVNVAIANLGCSMEEIAWYPPFTDSGEALARKFCPEVFYIAWSDL